MRNLIDVLNRIIEIDPELEQHFRSLKVSIMYTAPEIMYVRWNQAAHILDAFGNFWEEEYANPHPKAKEIAEIFSGRRGIDYVFDD